MGNSALGGVVSGMNMGGMGGMGGVGGVGGMTGTMGDQNSAFTNAGQLGNRLGNNVGNLGTDMCAE